MRPLLEDDAATLNAALRLALAWGEHWLAPIPQRLIELYPAMTPTEAEEWDRRCREIMNFAFTLCRRPGNGDAEALAARIGARYPLVDQDNRGRLASQGIYYARK